MEVKLDRKRSYGTVYGDPNIGYEQDNLQFRHDGTLFSPQKPAPTPAAVPTVESFPKAEDLPTAAADPLSRGRAAQSEAMKRYWAEKRQAIAKQHESEARDGVATVPTENLQSLGPQTA